MDHLIHLPEHYQYVYQFSDGKSQYRCGAAVLAMVGQIAFPGRWQSPTALMSQIYSQYTGSDAPDNHTGMSTTQLLDWLSRQGIGHIDMQPLVSNVDAIHAEIQAMNLQSVCQILLVSDESKLKYATNGEKLHNWVDTGMPHYILRVGYSDDHAYGLYYEPAAGLAFPHPVPILWSDIVAAGIEACIAVMPYHVDVPPAGFSYQTGQWPPAPPKPIDREALVSDLQLASSTLEAAAQALEQVPNTSFGNIPSLLVGVQHTISTVQAAHTRIVGDLTHA